MAVPTTGAGYDLKIMVGNGASPEVFAHPCLVNTTREFALTATTTDTPLVDCATPSNPNVVYRRKDTIDSRVQGAGRLHKTDMATYDAWAQQAATKNVRVEVMGSGGRRYSFAGHLTTFRMTGNDKETIECEIEIVPDGPVTPATIS